MAELPRRDSRRAHRRLVGLAADLRLLHRVIRAERFKLLNRQRALKGYHQKAADINEARRKKDEPADLEKALRRCLKEIAARRAGLSYAANKVVADYHSRVEVKLRRALRRRFENAVRTVKDKSKWIRENTGLEMPELRRYLELLFKPGMTWANHSFEGWHIDHKKPLASFNLADEAQRKQAFHYNNLQPLWAQENLAKRDRLE